MIYSFILVLVLGYLAGLLFSKIKLPKIIGMILIGGVLGYFSILSESFLDISSYLRKIALIIILTRAGLSVNFKQIKQIGRPAILMCFIPALFEIIATTIFAPLLLPINYLEALLLGSVLAAVSPAIIVPRMIKYKEQYESNKPNLMLVGSSLDDIFVMIIFYSVLGAFTSGGINVVEIPVSIVLGVVIGVIIGFLFKVLFSKVKVHSIVVVGITLITSILLTLLEEVIYYNSLISIILIGTFLISNIEINNIKNNYNKLWIVFEIILFVLVGAAVDFNVALSYGLPSVVLIIIILFFRSLGVFCCLIKTNTSKKETLFCIISYLPKATVQASIGAIALENNLSCGPVILSVAVLSILITAPLGAILLDTQNKKLLQ
ncbi:MAG: cation:proton antiporter [bacterium]